MPGGCFDFSGKAANTSIELGGINFNIFYLILKLIFFLALIFKLVLQG